VRAEKTISCRFFGFFEGFVLGDETGTRWADVWGCFWLELIRQNQGKKALFFANNGDSKELFYGQIDG
jgi:hypothetical protein